MGKKRASEIPGLPWAQGGATKGESALWNNRTFRNYFYRLQEISISCFEWKNLPETCDERFIELLLFDKGMFIFFDDPIIGYLSMMTTIDGPIDIYNIPMRRRAFASNGYNRELDITNSVLCFNNYIRQPSYPYIYDFAMRLYEVQRTIDVNIKTQKTPIMFTASTDQRLTAKNIAAEIEGNEGFIFLSDKYNVDSIKPFNLNTNFVADKLQLVKQRIWFEALSYLGIESANTEKKERLITDEVNANNQPVNFQRFARLSARQQACEKINTMFGLDLSVNFRDLDPYSLSLDRFSVSPETEEGADSE